MTPVRSVDSIAFSHHHVAARATPAASVRPHKQEDSERRTEAVAETSRTDRQNPDRPNPTLIDALVEAATEEPESIRPVPTRIAPRTGEDEEEAAPPEPSTRLEVRLLSTLQKSQSAYEQKPPKRHSLDILA